jgi:hypothetical protein
MRDVVGQGEQSQPTFDPFKLSRNRSRILSYRPETRSLAALGARSGWIQQSIDERDGKLCATQATETVQPAV